MRTCVQLLPRFHELCSRPTQAVASMTRICCVPVDNIGWLWTPATASVAGWHTSFENSTEPVLKKQAPLSEGSRRRRRLRGVTGGTGRTTLSLTTFDGSSQWEPSMDYFA